MPAAARHVRSVSVTLKQTPLGEILRCVADLTGTQFVITSRGVVFEPIPGIFYKATPNPITTPAPIPAKPHKPISREAFSEAVAVYRHNPLKAQKHGAYNIIMQYWDDLPSTEMITMLALSQLDGNLDQNQKHLLETAEVAGRISTTNPSDPLYSGILQIIETYKFLKKSNPALNSPVVESWITSENNGTLKTELEEKLKGILQAVF